MTGRARAMRRGMAVAAVALLLAAAVGAGAVARTSVPAEAATSAASRAAGAAHCGAVGPARFPTASTALTVTVPQAIPGHETAPATRATRTQPVCPRPPAVTGGSILFVGNSFTQGFEEPATSYNRGAVVDANGSGVGGVAGVFKRLTDAEGMTFDVTVEAVGGRTLGWHAANRASVLSQRWDAVVAQDLSTLPLPTARGGDRPAFRADARAVRDLVHAGNPSASLFLYETWASPTGAQLQGYAAGEPGLRRMQADLRAAYAGAGREAGAEVAPVGDAFERAVSRGVVDATPADGLDPGTVSLWSTKDHRHANAFGSYLAAAVIYATVTQRDPRALPTGPGSAASDLGIPAATATALHRLAHAAVQARAASTR